MKSSTTIQTLRIVLSITCFFGVTDALGKTYPVTGTLAGMAVNTTVDSAIAQHIINNDLQHLSDAELIDISTRLSCSSTHELPDAQILQQLTRDYSTDTATALLIECLASIPDIHQSQQLFLSELKQQRDGNPKQATFVSGKVNQYLILFVPGWGYQSNGHETGSDLRVPREIITKLGFESHLLPIEENGSVEGNATSLIATLDQYLLKGKRGKKIILVSASSGGPTVALALSDPGFANNPQIVGWLNICGVLRGSPVIDHFLSWPKSWMLRVVAFFKGWKFQNLKSLSRTRGRARYDKFTPPSQLTVLNYIGIPFSGQMSRFGQRFYTLLKDLGPNDGLTLITDALAPGYTVMAVGSDHFVREDPDIDTKTAVLLPFLLKLIEG